MEIAMKQIGPFDIEVEVHEEWPELVPLQEYRKPSIPGNLFPAWVNDFVEALTVATETPRELVAGIVLAVGSVAVSRRLHVFIREGYTEPGNLWVVVALPPGNRKSAVLSAVTKPLVEWEHQVSAAADTEIKRTESERKTLEARAKELRNQAAKERNEAKARDLAMEAADIEASLPEAPSRPRIWTSDATPEKLGVLLADHGEVMAWLSSEGGLFDMLAGRYSSGIPNLDLILKAHSGDPERVDRGSRPPVFLGCPRLTIGLTPQPDVLRGIASRPGFRGRGLLARFLFFLPLSQVGYRTLETPPVHQVIRKRYQDGIRSMLDWPEVRDTQGELSTHPVRFSAAAYQAWMDFARAIEEKMRPGSLLAGIDDWASKAPGAAARIALVLHGFTHAEGHPWDHEITGETMESALELMAVATSHALAAFDLAGGDRAAASVKALWAWIERGRLDQFTVRDAFNGLRGTFSTVADLRDAIDDLEERGYLRLEERTHAGPGRKPSPLVRVRPELVEGWR